MMLIILCFSAEVMFDHVSICETPVCGIATFESLLQKAGGWNPLTCVQMIILFKKIGLKLSLCLLCLSCFKN